MFLPLFCTDYGMFWHWFVGVHRHCGLNEIWFSHLFHCGIDFVIVVVIWMKVKLLRVDFYFIVWCEDSQLFSFLDLISYRIWILDGPDPITQPPGTFTIGITPPSDKLLRDSTAISAVTPTMFRVHREQHSSPYATHENPADHSAAHVVILPLPPFNACNDSRDHSRPLSLHHLLWYKVRFLQHQIWTTVRILQLKPAFKLQVWHSNIVILARSWCWAACWL